MTTRRDQRGMAARQRRRDCAHREATRGGPSPKAAVAAVAVPVGDDNHDTARLVDVVLGQVRDRRRCPAPGKVGKAFEALAGGDTSGGRTPR